MCCWKAAIQKGGRLKPRFRTLLCMALAAAVACGSARAGDDWPMLAHDAARSGATATQIKPPFERKWYRLFADEGLMAGVQPIVAGGKVFIGTMRGVLHAMDADSGKDVWTFTAGGAILHACAVAGGKVIFGAADGKLYAVSAADGLPQWTVQTGAAIWNSPAVHENLVLIGSRDGKLYCVALETGKTQWAAATGGPLLSSPAVDAKAGRACVASEDMRVYAFKLSDGGAVWRSDKLPGVSFRGYHPVVAPDGSVLVTVSPGIGMDTIHGVLYDMVKEIFGDFSSWRHKKEENARLRAENLKLMENPETYPAQLNYFRKRLAETPALQTFFVLDAASGKQKFVTPLVFAESMNGTGMPAIVTPEGKVIVKYQALLRSRYEHYSPFLNVGYLDTASGNIAPLMDESRTYGWHDSLLLVHDEQSQLMVTGRILVNAHQDNVNALDLDTLKGFPEPWCVNIHEPQKGEALAIWARLLRNQPVPAGKEWLARGTAVYGGGSAIDVPVTVAGDSFYYLPTHEINSGASVIAYKTQPGGKAPKTTPLPPETLSDDEWKKVQELPWDWDTLAMPRLNHVLAALPGKIPGTRQQPLTDEAAKTVAAIADEQLDAVVWQAPVVDGAKAAAHDQWKGELVRAVAELISKDWQPLLFPAGKFPEETYRFFNEPSETLYTLALAWPHLDAALGESVRARVSALSAPGGPLAGALGQKTYSPNAGEVRSAYDPPPEKKLRIHGGLLRTDLARLYPQWLWAHVSGDWSRLEANWKSLRGQCNSAPGKIGEDCLNGHLAGLIAYCRIARHLKDDAAVAEGLAVTRKAMRERLTYELSHTRGGLIYRIPQERALFSRWEHLTPDVARLCAGYAKPVHERLMAVYVDYHRPTWWLAWNIETMMRNECALSFPTLAAEVFAARAMLLGEPAEKLSRYLDLPWCKADEYYIQKLAHTLNAAAGVDWQAMR